MEGKMTNTKLIFYYIKKYFKRDFVIFSLFAITSTILSAPIPFIYKKIIDGITSLSFNNLLYLVLFYVLLIIISVCTEYLKDRKIASFQYAVAFTVSTSVYERVLGLPYSILAEKHPGDIMKLVQEDSSNLYNLITYGIFKIISIVLQLIVNFSILIYLFGWRVLFILCVLPIYYLLIRKGSNNVEKYGFTYEQASNEWSEDAYSPLGKLKEVKSRRIENYLINKIKKSYSKVRKEGIKYGHVSNLLYSFYSFFDKGIYLFIFIFGIYSVRSGSMSIGSFFAIIYVVSSIISGFNNFSLAIINDFQKRLPSINRIVELFSIDIPNSDKAPLLSKNNEILFNDVYFSYSNSLYSLKIPFLHLKSGFKYVLVGETGSGKSTLFDLVNGIRYPERGSIKINGIATTDIEESWWKSNVFILLQDSTIFRGNLGENILLDDLDKRELVNKIIIKYNFENFFNRFKNGLLTEPKEGNALSGGEKRIIGIIRLLLKPYYPIILIDEGKIGLDITLRYKLNNILEQKLKNRLSITITHDLEEFTNFNQVIFIHKGTVFTGKHDELLINNKYYKQFILHGKGNDNENVKI